MAEHVSEIIFGLVYETFDVEVASLLGGLVLEGLVFKFLLAFLFLEGGMNIKVFAFVFFTVELIDGFLGATRTILNVVFIWRSEADEVELLGWVFRALTFVKGRNVAVWSKESSNLVVSHIGGQVLHEDVVEGLSLVSAALRVKLDADKALLLRGHFKSFFRVLGVLETNESVAA